MHIKLVLLDLRKRYPKAQVKGHKELCATGCPGKYYPLADMMTFYRKAIDMEGDGLSMTQYAELKEEINKIKARVGYFNYIDDNMNEAYKPTIEKLVAAGKLCGNEKGELMLTTDMMRILTVLDRCGVF